MEDGGPGGDSLEGASALRTRRWVLGGALAVIAAAGAGAAVELLGADDDQRAAPPLRRSSPPRPPTAPAALVAAARAERALIADLDATTGGTPDVRLVIVAARADHAAHLQALEALLARYAAVPSGGAAGRPRTRAALRAAEDRAAAAAARLAATLTGPPAVLLASIAACEATHADLLS